MFHGYSIDSWMSICVFSKKKIIRHGYRMDTTTRVDEGVLFELSIREVSVTVTSSQIFRRALKNCFFVPVKPMECAF